MPDLVSNEFGVNDATARKEDRLRYIADLTGLFATLEIPWQQWFMVMDSKSGEVDPELLQSFGLVPQ